MANNADGSIRIDTTLDDSGFRRGCAKLIGSIDSLVNSVGRIGDKIKHPFEEGGSYINLLRENGYSLMAPFTKLSELFQGALFVSMLKAGTAAKAFNMIMAGAVKVTKGIGKAIKDTVGKFLAFRRGARSVEDITKRMTGALTSFRTLLMARVKNAFISLLTADIGTAMQEFAKYNSEFNQAMSRMKTLGSTVSGNIATLFANMITAVEPIVTKLLSLINQAITYISTLFSLLSGKNTVSVATAKAQDYAQATNDTADATKDAAKQQKKWNNELYSFDELTRQSKKEESDSSGNGSGSGAAASPFTWTEKPLGINLKNLDFKKLGYDLAEKLADALDKIPWDKIKKAAYNIGDKFAEFLNGVFSNLHLANSLGKTIGEALNTAVQFALGFVRKFDFSQFGKWMGTLWNSLIRTFDFDALAEVITRGGNGVIDALHSFLSTTLETSRDLGVGLGKLWNSIYVGIDFGKLAETILLGVANLNRILEGLNRTIQWDKAAQNVINGINTLIRGQVMNSSGQLESVWAENGRQVGKLIGGFVHYVCEIINGVDWRGIGTGIATWFNNALKEIKPEDFAGIISGFINGVFNTVYGFLSTLDWDGLADWISSAVNYMIFNVDWILIGQTIGTLFKNALGALRRAVDNTDWVALGKALGDALEQIDWIGVFTSLAGTIFKVFSGMLTGLFSSEGGRAFLATVAAIEGLKLAIGLGGKVVTLAAESLAKSVAIKLGLIAPGITAETPKIVSALGAMAKAVGIAAGAVADALLLAYDTQALMDASQTYREAQNAHIRETQTALDNYKKLYQTKGPEVAAEWAKTCYQIDTTGMSLEQGQKALTKKVDSLWDDVPQNMWQGFKQGWNSYFGEGGKGLTSLLGDAFTGAVSGVRSILGINSPSKVFEGIGQNVVAGFQNGFSSIWSKVSSNALKAWTNLRTSFGNIKWDVIGNNLVAGLSKGFGGAWSGLTTMVSNCANNLVSRIKSAFGISSPSKVFAQIGEYLDAGLEKGILNGQKDLLKTATQLAGAVTSDMTPDSPKIGSTVDEAAGAIGTLTDRLSDFAAVFQAIADTLASMGGLNMPQIAAGTVVPYKARVDTGSVAGEDSGAATDSLARILTELQNQTQVMRTAGSNRESRVVQLVLDGKVIYNTILDENGRAKGRLGYNPLMR